MLSLLRDRWHAWQSIKRRIIIKADEKAVDRDMRYTIAWCRRAIAASKRADKVVNNIIALEKEEAAYQEQRKNKNVSN